MDEVTRGLKNMDVHLDNILVENHSEGEYSAELCAHFNPSAAAQKITLLNLNWESAAPIH